MTSGYDALDELYERLRGTEDAQRAGGITPETIRAARGGVAGENGRIPATAAESAAHADSVPLVDISHDTRESIEADLEALTKRWHDYDGDFMKIYSSVAYAQVKELLDRQAALTERHWMEINGANTLANIELNKQREELQDANDNLQKRILGLEDEVLSLESKLDERDETYCGASIEEWHELAVRMEAERDRLQDVVALLRVAQAAHRETHMKLPLDADGVPIHMGDYLSSDEYNGEKFVCMGLDVEVRGESEYWSVGKRLDSDTGCVEYTAAHRCHHVETPDSWERICADLRAMDGDNLIALSNGQYVEDTRHDEIAARIERMAKE